MKIKLLTVAFLSGLLVSSANATEQFKAADQSVTSDICVTALSGNRAELYSKIRGLGYSRAFVTKHITCNDTPLLSFVEQHGKNSEAILDMMQPREFETSISDIAMYHKTR